jgi:lipoprotein-anchoring transpeptidase ErfK/SrfK
VLLGTAALLTAGGSLTASAPSPDPTHGPSSALSSSPAIESPSPSALPRSPSPAAEPTHSIHVNLSTQHLTAYEGDTVIASTDVTTGAPELPTVTGEFHIMAKYSPYTFVSPWGPGSPYFYNPLSVNYAMLFADGGYFIHDAWWQRNFGPGGNLKTGSHGCVNVPTDAMPAIYQWARVGDEVIVTDS